MAIAVGEIMILILLSFFLSVRSVSGRVRTAGTGTGTVATLTPGMTTVSGAAWFFIQNLDYCNACMPSQLTLGPDPNDGAASHSPVVPPVVGTQNGCATLTVTCVATTLMTFQNGLGGPASAAATLLLCNTMGVYQLGDISGPAIPAVHCLG